MRKTLSGISPYQVKSEAGDIIRLDSNEAYTSLLSYVNFSELEKTLINRYPDESTEALIEAYSRFSGFPQDNLLAGNGSDECITLICQYALDPGDTVMVLDPDFSMYEKNARIMGANVEKIALNADFSMPLSTVLDKIEQKKPKLFFLSSPNNPTGRQYEKEEIEQIIAALDVNGGGILVLDEAYIDFAGESPFAPKLRNYKNLIILRTASKALGMAALRLGFLASNDSIIEGIGAVKPPYNVNTVSAQIGIQLLKKPELLDQFLIMQLAQIAELEDIMKELAASVEGSVLYPSSANFYLMKLNGAKALADFLYERKIKIRHFGGSLAAVRISAGTKNEHAKLRAALKEWSESYAPSVQ